MHEVRILNKSYIFVFFYRTPLWPLTSPSVITTARDSSCWRMCETLCPTSAGWC